jgi:hypothetical protein
MAKQGLISLLVLTIISLTIMYYSTKGMCRWTENNNPIVFFLKHLLNSILLGIPGIMMFFQKGKDCLLTSPHNSFSQVGMNQQMQPRMGMQQQVPPSMGMQQGVPQPPQMVTQQGY